MFIIIIKKKKKIKTLKGYKSSIKIIINLDIFN